MSINTFTNIKLFSRAIKCYRCVLGAYLITTAFEAWGQQSSFYYDASGNASAVLTTGTSSPVIQAQPQTQLSQTNTSVSFSIVASGVGNSYQWLSNGVAITGATSDTLFLPNLTGTNGTFSVIVSNASGSVTSTPAVIWADSNGNGIPDWWEIKYFGNLNQTANGDYDGDGVSNLKEYREGTNPTNSSSYNPRLLIQYAGPGRVLASPDLPYYTNGQSVTLTAVPDSGQGFLGWSGSAFGNNSPLTFLISSNSTLIGNFGLPLGIALDNTNLNWTTGGSAPWFGQTQISENGLGAAQSGSIVGGQQSWLQTTVDGPTQPSILRFWWRVSSQPPDALSLSIDGSASVSISGENVAWQEEQALLSPGTHMLLWTYIKQSNDNPSGVPFSDAAWVDEVSVTASGTNCIPLPDASAPWWGALTGGVVITNVSGGTGFHFTGGYVQLPQNLFPYPTNATGNAPFSFGTWFETASDGVILGQQTINPSSAFPVGYVPALYVGTNGNLYAAMFYDAGNWLESPEPVNDGTFHFVAVTYNGTNETLFLDGSAIQQKQLTQNAYAGQYYYQIGTGFSAGWPGGYYGWFPFDGIIDQPLLYTRALTSNEVVGIFQAGPSRKCQSAPTIVGQPRNQVAQVGGNVLFSSSATGEPPPSYQWFLEDVALVGATASTLFLSNVQPTNAGGYSLIASNAYGSTTSAVATLTVQTCVAPPVGLVAWWRGEGNALDSAGTNNGTLQGEAAFAPGEAGQSFIFDGTNGCVNLPYSQSYDFAPSGQFTLETWLNPNVVSQYQAIAVKSPITGIWDWGLYMTPASQFMAGFHNVNAVTSVTAAQSGQWYHVAAVYTNGNWTLFVNGVIEAQASGLFFTQSMGGFAIARKGQAAAPSPSNFLGGRVDEISIYNRALNPSEIAAIYNAGVAGKCMSRPVTMLGGIVAANGSVVVRGAGGPFNGSYYVLTSTNVALPMSNWLRLSTNPFNTDGTFSFTNACNPTTPQQFYRIQLP